MAESTDQRQRPEEMDQVYVEEVDIEIEPAAGVSPDTPHNHTDDNPPEYAEIEGGGPAGETSGAPPLSYEALMAGDDPSRPRSPKVLTVEAPPSYLQLFGKEETDGARQRHRHQRLQEEEERRGHWRLLNLLPTDQKSAVRCGLVVTLLVFLSVVALSMIVVGLAHYNQCLVQEVPLYLVVAGIFILVELVLHSLLWIAQKLSNDKPLYSLVRKFDCIALFLIVWLVVGSAWIFKAGRERSCGTSGVDYVDYVIPDNFTGSQEDLEPTESDCGEDCPSGVYVFTVFLILFQYLMVLLLGLCCCTSSVRSRH